LTPTNSAPDKNLHLTKVMETLLNTINEAVTIVDNAGTVTHWNRAAEELYGISAKEIIGKKISDFTWKSLMISKVFASQEPIRQAYHEPKPGIHVLVNTSPVQDGQQTIAVVSTEQDITKLVRLGNELYSTSAQLRHLEAKVTRYDSLNDPFSRIKGNGVAVSHSVKIARRVAATDATVLITGESGVGKELFTHAIHLASPRANQKFVAINCGAIPDALFESELFGYATGAFTGASRGGKPGKIELANDGTLFLDEIGELPLDMQVKLLRVLQEKQFYRVGATESTRINVRILAATNKKLEELIAQGRFREDLYYRLNVVSLEIPPLRERTEDIPELIQLFTREVATQYGKPTPAYDSQVIVTMMAYPWPGNIRELRNVIERLVILTDTEQIGVDALPTNMTVQNTAFRQAKNRQLLPVNTAPGEYEELEHLKLALRTTFGNKAAAARILGISRGTLYNKMRRYNLTNLLY
jgi:sigma-54 dependent transcriptional regulator, acetoin dehydrogenase operon transcriptional activator AcoR